VTFEHIPTADTGPVGSTEQIPKPHYSILHYSRLETTNQARWISVVFRVLGTTLTVVCWAQERTPPASGGKTPCSQRRTKA
jgi:hypothetical protein